MTQNISDDWFIDVDTHVTEPPDVWIDRVPARFRDLVPRVERDEDGVDQWMMGGEPFYMVGRTSTVDWPEPFPAGPRTYDDIHPASYDANARLAYMDSQGIWAQALYPNVAGFGAQRFLQFPDDELKLVCVRAYNDFLRDWASADPRRLITIMSTPFWDVDAAVAEMARCADAGHKGILFTGEPHRFGLPFLADHHWDPLWAAAQDLDLPVHFHIGSGDGSSSFTPERVAATGTAPTYAVTSVEMFLKNGVQVADLLLSGILPRFEKLQFVSVESGVGWIPFVLEAVDHSDREARIDHKSEWDRMPSEYFATNVYACYWFETAATTEMLNVLPAERILFETDFPHPTCLYGNVQERVEQSLRGTSADVRHKILWENAANLYGIEAPDAPRAR
ncbi:MAG: amidohydrolase family protein [Microbacterium sp.]